MRALVAAAAASLVVACNSLFGIGELPPLAESPDAGNVNARDAMRDAAPRFCETNANSWFCADFDQDEDVTVGFDPPSRVLQWTGGGGRLEADTERFHSEPRAARMSTPVLLAKARALAHLQKTLPRDVRVFRVQAAVRIETEGFSEDGAVYTIFQLAFVASGGITISRGRQGTYLDTIDLTGTAPQTNQLLTEPMSVGRWYVLRLLVTLPTTAGTKGDIEVLVDGIPAGTVDIPFSLVSGTGDRALGIGMVGNGPMREAEMSFDDVRIEIID